MYWYMRWNRELPKILPKYYWIKICSESNVEENHKKIKTNIQKKALNPTPTSKNTWRFSRWHSCKYVTGSLWNAFGKCMRSWWTSVVRSCLGPAVKDRLKSFGGFMTVLSFETLHTLKISFIKLEEGNILTRLLFRDSSVSTDKYIPFSFSWKIRYILHIHLSGIRVS